MRIRYPAWVPALLAALCSAPAQAAPITSDILFETTSQSMWASGSGTEVSFNEFYGVEWDKSGAFGVNAGIGSANVSGSTSGKVGIEIDLEFGTGTVDAMVPFKAGLDFSYTDFVDGRFVTIGTVADLQTANSLLQTSFPKLELGADLVVEVAASFQASGCVDLFVYSDCGGTGNIDLIDTGEQRLELLAVNRDGDGEVRLVPALQELREAADDLQDTAVDVGETLNDINNDLKEKNEDGTEKNKLQKTRAVLENIFAPELGGVSFGSGDIASVEVRLPEIETSGGTEGDVLKASGADNFLDLNIDVDGLMTAAGLLPPLEISANFSAGAGIANADVHALLADIVLTPSLSLEQEFTLTPEVVMDLNFNRAVTIMYDGQQMTGTAFTGLRTGSSESCNLGICEESFQLLWDEGAGPLQIDPTYRTTVMLNNKLDLGLDLNLHVEALSLSADISVGGYDIAKPGFGPVINEDFGLGDLIGLPDVNIFNKTFSLQGFNSATGNSITLDTSGAIFTGQGATTLWSDNGNWSGAAPDTGTDVVIDLQNTPVNVAGLVLNDNRNVGNLTIGQGASLLIDGATLSQDEGARTLSNAGEIHVIGGALNVSEPITGGGLIQLLNGQLHANATTGLRLQGQDILGVGNDIINADRVVIIDSRSSISAQGTSLALNATNSNFATNLGTIAANGGAFNWNVIDSDQLHYQIANGLSGRMEATNGGVLTFDRNDAAFGCGFICERPADADRFLISGGTLATDASSSIVFKDNLALASTPHINGNVTVEGAVHLFSGVRNDGFFSFDGMTVQNAQTLALSGGGTAHFEGRIEVLDIPQIGTDLPGSATLINGEGHTLQGSGDIFTDITLINLGIVSATGAAKSLTIYADTTNTGTMRATGGGTLILQGSVDTSQGRVTANGGNVTVKGNLEGASTTGPGGVWTASNGNTIALENGAQQWNSLTSGVLNGGEIVLSGNGSDFTVNGISLEDSLNTIGTTGKLTLVNHLFNRADFPTKATVQVQGVLELIGGEIDTGSSGFPNLTLGTVAVAATGLVTGYGTIDSNVTNLGTIRAEGQGRTLTIEGGIGGGGRFEVTNGATLNMQSCSFLGFACPFIQTFQAQGQISGNQFIVNSTGALTTLKFTGAGDEALIKSLNFAKVELQGAGAQVSMRSEGLFSSQTFGLGQTLRTLSGSTLALSDGQHFVAANAATLGDSSVRLSNNSSLQLTGSTTSYAGTALNVLSGSSVEMAGATLDVNSLTLGSGTTIEGYGTVTGHGFSNTVGNGGSIVANDGVLEFANTHIIQSGAGNLSAAAVTPASALPAGAKPDAASVLKLTNTTVNGGTVDIGVGALLTGNGKFSSVDASNAGAIRVGAVGDGITSFSNSTLDNLAGGAILVTNSTLSLESTGVVNDGRIRAFSRNTDSADSVIQLADSSINGGTVLLISEPDVTLVAQPGDPTLPPQRIEAAPATQAILQGYGTLSNVDLTIDAYSLVDANVQGEKLTFDIGTGTITNLGLMRASDGGILTLSGGTIAGTGDVRALADSVVEIENMTFDGVSLNTEGSGVIRDIATSSFTNLSNSGNFEVAGDVTVVGNLNNAGGFVRILDKGTLVIADGPLPNGSPFALDGGTLQVDQGGTVNGNPGVVLAAANATIGGSGIINPHVVLSGASVLNPGSDGAAGTLSLMGDLTTSVESSIVFDIFNGSFDVLDVDGLLDLRGTVVLNFMDEIFIDELVKTVTSSFSIFDLFLGVEKSEFSLFGNLAFEGLSSTRMTSVVLAQDGFFTISDIGTIPPESVPEPGTLWLMLFSLLVLMMIRHRVRVDFRLRG